MLLILSLPQYIVASNNKTKKEILDLRQKISSDLSNNMKLNEKYYKHKMAQQQAKLLILTATNFIYTYHGGKKSYKQIKEFVEYAYMCSFIFPSLGQDHLEVFVTYLRWAEAETGYTPDMISSWKKGQQIKNINRKGVVTGYITITFDSKDYGILQVNNRNVKYVRGTAKNLYKSGTVPFKIKNIRTVDDLLDIKTNLVARSIIEVDRKNRGWEWKHWRFSSMDFYNKLRNEISNMKRQEIYDVNLIQKYYHLIPVKIYNGQNS